jgi:C-terminal processing protease CtpA/Prc
LGFSTVGILLAGGAGAQEVSWTYMSPSGGWVGISVNFVEGEEGGLLAIVSEVVEGSPAQATGMRVGDTITYLDGRPVSPKRFAALPENLQPGDVVRFTVQRGEEAVDLLVEAASKTEAVVFARPNFQEIMVKLDTVRGAILKDLDSLRLNIGRLHLEDTGAGVSLEIVTVPPHDEELWIQNTPWSIRGILTDTLLWGSDFFAVKPDFAVPFEAFWAESQEMNTVQRELLKVRSDLTGVRRRELSRQRELAAAIQGPIEEILRRDQLIQALRAQEEELVAQQESLTAQLRKIREEEFRSQWIESESRAEAALTEAQRAAAEAQRERARTEAETDRRHAEQVRELEAFYDFNLQRFRSPLMVGLNVIMGADIKPLTPAMSEVLSAEQGVVVYEVVAGTPAAEVGLQDLDVIVRVGGEEIISIGDLRLSLTEMDGPFKIQVIRKGEREPVVLTVRR